MPSTASRMQEDHGPPLVAAPRGRLCVRRDEPGSASRLLSHTPDSSECPKHHENGGTDGVVSTSQSMWNSFIVRTVDFCTRHAWPAVIVAVAVAAGSGAYAMQHFSINTNISNLI